MIKLIIFLSFMLLSPLASNAYIGPGMGGGVILATIGVIVAIFAAIFGIIWFPIKRFLKKRKKNQNTDKSL
jgi:hypothetical protein|tara:strand:- start:1 stop:213 length:213 start_codon:yes stop_codon:yes gene_type:complete